jgi:probable addiction module antidote protein
MSKSISYNKSLVERLKKPKEAAAYLNAALEDEDVRVFLVALRDVAEAHGGISYLAKETDLNRESLYRTLSIQGNPTIMNLFLMLNAFGLEFNVKATAV